MADALDSGSSDRKVVEVQVLSSAPKNYPNLLLLRKRFGFFYTLIDG